MASTDVKLGQQIKDNSIMAAEQMKEGVKDAAVATKQVAGGVAYTVADAAIDAKDKVVEGATTGWNSISSAGAAMGHATAEKSHSIAESYNRTLATSETLDSKQRMDAAKSALEHHALGKEHRITKEADIRQSGINELTAKTSELASSAKDSAVVGAAVVAEKAGVVAGVVAEKTAPVVEVVRERANSAAAYVSEVTAPVVDSVKNTAVLIQEKAVGAAESVAQTVVTGAKAVQESALNAKLFVEFKAEEASDAFKESVTNSAIFIQEMANEAADVVRPGVENLKDKTLELSENVVIGAQSTWYAVSSVGAAASHAAAETTHAFAETYNARQAISDSLDSKTRMEAAKSALEHHAMAKQHRDLKELNEVAAGIPELKRGASEAVKQIPAQVSSTLQAIPPVVKGAAVSAGQYAQVAGQYVASGASSLYVAATTTQTDIQQKKLVEEKDKAINTGLPVSERMEIAKNILEKELPVKQIDAPTMLALPVKQIDANQSVSQS